MSKTSIVVLLLLVAVMVLEVNYFRQKTNSGGIETEVTKETESAEENLTLKKEMEDSRIIGTVEAYQTGYKEGCPKDAKMRKTDPVGGKFERSYILGFEKGKKVCSVKRKKEQEKEYFQKGYVEGCSTAGGKPVQNKEQYLKKGSYYKGWDKGYKECKKSEAPKTETGIETKTTEQKKSTVVKNRINRQSPEYQKGYRQGCDASGGNFYRDEELYLQSREYRAGWTEGREQCKNRRTTEKSRAYNQQESRLFGQGYDDGCDTAQGYYRKDRYKYENYLSYRKGWLRGERECVRQVLPPPPPIPVPPFGF